jgi:Protein of unknown function (DUF3147)
VSTPVVLVLKGLAGGTFVVVFALIGSTVRPKRFAGLFSAAPSVATASLLIAAYSSGLREITHDAQALIVGAVAMIVAALLGLPLLGRLSAFRTSLCITGFWAGAAAIGYVAVLR